MVKARAESQKSGKQKGWGKRDRGKEKRPNEEIQCKRPVCCRYTFPERERWKERGINKREKP